MGVFAGSENRGAELLLPWLIESWVRVGSLDRFISVYGAFPLGVSAAGRISETHHSESWEPESDGAWLAFDTASHSTFTQRIIRSVAPWIRSCARLWAFCGEPNRHSSYPQGLPSSEVGSIETKSGTWIHYKI